MSIYKSFGFTKKVEREKNVTTPAGTKTRTSRCTDQQVLPVTTYTHTHNINLSVSLAGDKKDMKFINLSVYTIKGEKQ